MEVKDKLLQKVSEDVNVPLDVVEKIVSFQFKHANEATHFHRQVEISGFGKFLMNKRALESRIKNLEASLIKMAVQIEKQLHKEEYQKKIDGTLETLKFLKQRLSEF